MPDNLYILLQDFADLPAAHQRIFLFCLAKLPVLKRRSGDLQRLAAVNQVSYRTAQRAIQSIEASPILSSCVKIKTSQGSPEFVSFDERKHSHKTESF